MTVAGLFHAHYRTLCAASLSTIHACHAAYKRSIASSRISTTPFWATPAVPEAALRSVPTHHATCRMDADLTVSRHSASGPSCVPAYAGEIGDSPAP